MAPRNPVARPRHDPYSEATEAFDIKAYQPRDAGTSWAVLDAHGKLIEALSYRPYLKQDPASTTKLMTLYAVLTKIQNGKLSANFVDENRSLIDRMLIQSDNQAAQSLAQLANPRHSYREFCLEMTELAHKRGLRNSNFVTPEGYPMPGTFSNAADMARLSFLLQRDFPQYTHLAGQIQAEGIERINTGSQLLTNGVLFGKTGTGDSATRRFAGYGGRAKFAYTGAIEGGFVAVAAASTRDERNGIVLGAVTQLAEFMPPQVSKNPAPRQSSYPLGCVLEHPWMKQLSCVHTGSDDSFALPGFALRPLPTPAPTAVSPNKMP